jgi:quinol monooxygenase YgiN
LATRYVTVRGRARSDESPNSGGTPFFAIFCPGSCLAEGQRVGRNLPVMSSDVEIVLVTATFQAAPGREAALAAVLAKYVVLSRQQAGCRNIDLAASTLVPGRLLLLEKWESTEAQQAHFNSREMVEMAEAAKPLLAAPPDFDLLDGISAHDLA